MPATYFPPLPCLTGDLTGQIKPGDEIPGHCLSWHGGEHHWTHSGFLDAPATIPAGSVRALDFAAKPGLPALRIGTQSVRREVFA